MDDTVSSRFPQRPRPPWLTPAMAVAGVALIGYGLFRVIFDPSPTPKPAVPSPSSVTTTAAPTPTGPALKGLEGTLPPATQLLVGGQHPAVIGGPTQWLNHLPVRATQSVTGAFAVKGGVVVQLRFLLPSNEGPGSRFYLVRGDGSYRFLGAGDRAVARQDQRAVYALTAARPGSAGTLTELSLDGATLSRRQVPDGLQVWADSAEGLLVTSDPQPGNQYADLHLINATSLVSTRDLGQVSYVESATSQYVAWQPTGCAATCGLLLADLTRGSAPLKITQVAGHSIGSVAISPSGRDVAISWLDPSGGPGFVEVVNLASDVRRTVPGVATAALQAADLAWTPDGQSLAVAVVLAGDVRRVGLWRLTGGPVQVLADRFVEAEDTASTLLVL
jgi:hypothetical protein